MKKIKIQNFLILFALIAALLIGCGKSDNKTNEVKSNSDQTQTSPSGQGEVVEVKLSTIQCGTCKKNIEGAVRKIEGVNEVNVSVKDKIAKVNYDKSKTDLSKIEGAIVMAGYQANDKPADKKAYDKLESCCKVGGH